MQDALLSSSAELAFFPPPEAWQKSRACCAPKIFLYRRDFSRKAGPEGNIIKLKISLPSQVLCPPEPALLCSPWTASPSLQEAHGLSWSLLGCPSCEKDRRVFSSAGRPAATLLRHEIVNPKCVWYKQSGWVVWVTRALIIFFGKCGTDVWKTHDGPWRKKREHLGAAWNQV